MQATKSAPNWAVELVKEVCKDYKRALPLKLSWRNYKNDQFTSGFTLYDGSKISISAGTDQVDQELVLLHELAHFIINKRRKGKNIGHTARFWRLAFELYDRYGINLEYALYREEHYRLKATQAYQHQLAKRN